MNSPSDSELVFRCLDGDQQAFATLVERYQGAVYATAFYYVGRYQQAEDVAQEAFFAAYRSLPHLRDPDRFAAWLREITTRTAANWLRRNAARLQQETPLPFRRTIDFEDVRRGPSFLLSREEQIDRVQKAVDALPERYRLPVVLRYLQELPYDEISRFTGESKDEIRGILHRASRQLREILTDITDEGDGTQWRPANK